MGGIAFLFSAFVSGEVPPLTALHTSFFYGSWAAQPSCFAVPCSAWSTIWSGFARSLADSQRLPRLTRPATDGWKVCSYPGRECWYVVLFIKMCSTVVHIFLLLSSICSFVGLGKLGVMCDSMISLVYVWAL